jgi:FAD-dependent oxidoreductase domain-containing protein 1
VDYIQGEVMWMKKHRKHDNQEDMLNYEANIFLPDSRLVYPIHYARVVIAAGAQSGNVGRMAGIGTGRGPLYMDIPVEPRRGYIFELKCSDGPGLNFPQLSDPSGLYVRRDGLLGHYLVGKLPNDDMNEKIPQNIFGDVDPQYFEEEILPLLQYRIPGFKNYTLMGSRPIDYDHNYMDGSPVVGVHPILSNVFMATGFNGRGAMYAPGVGRALTELMLDQGYSTIDLSRFSFDRFLNRVDVKEQLYN